MTERFTRFLKRIPFFCSVTNSFLTQIATKSTSLFTRFNFIFLWALVCLACVVKPGINRPGYHRDVGRTPVGSPIDKKEGFTQKGVISYYGERFHGRKTANGEIYDMNALTAAHPSLPFNTRVKVKNLRNGKTVTVRINDRGPFKKGRVLDLSWEAARIIGMLERGTVKATLQVL